ncbi:hypothetical protein NHX12_028034 [Muraenolepis orangiensis]|uniref:protein N-terminal methyltransferase n=1 Tax=Muraenolepis orangiensis TaxID=630683 RepID=A0A9Q0EFT2_9TELE|nr:hypothetical protein NHX12_028034 [Muraenolepis orangiensis]
MVGHQNHCWRKGQCAGDALLAGEMCCGLCPMREPIGAPDQNLGQISQVSSGFMEPRYNSRHARENHHSVRMGEEAHFYGNAEVYWRDVPPTVDGMLGGYGKISNLDLNGSQAFLKKFTGEAVEKCLPMVTIALLSSTRTPKEGEGKTGTACALDCGAGIGRITKRLLLPLFQTVDLVDVTQEFLDQAKTYLGEDSKRVGHYFCTGLQDFVPEQGRYDVIWIQWVIGHLTDAHLVKFLGRCQSALRPGGLVVIKDNVAFEGVVPDDVDSSVCRDLDIVRRLVAEAGLCIVHQEQQMDFPKEIYQVHTLALR